MAPTLGATERLHVARPSGFHMTNVKPQIVDQTKPRGLHTGQKVHTNPGYDTLITSKSVSKTRFE